MTSAAPQPPAAQEADEEACIEDLRLQAFRTNDLGDREAYFEAASRWFQNRHFRRLNAHPAPADDRVRELEEDKERLDWLDAVNLRMNERNGSVYGWKYDINHNRASLTDHNLPALTIREAIDCARFPEKAGEIIAASVKEGARRADFDRRFPGVRERARAIADGGK